MQYNPLPFQTSEIAKAVANAGYALFLDPGMGKTGITLAVHCVLQHHKAIEATLVIVPLRPMYLTWPAEAAKWDQFKHLRLSIIHGTPAQRLKAMRTPADVYLINPENVDWLAKLGMDEFNTVPQMLVVDESTRFKNATRVRHKALKTLLPAFKHVKILTGTCAPQGIEDLFAQVQLIDGGAHLGRYITHFRKRFMEAEFIRVAGGRMQEIWHPRKGAHLEVADAIKGIATRLEAKDYLNMPPITYNVIPVELPPLARKAYSDITRTLVAHVGDDVLTVKGGGAATMKLRQITNGWAYSENGSVGVHTAKLDALADLVEEMQCTPLLVAVAFLHEVDAIREALKDVLPAGTEVPYLGGGVNRHHADSIVNLWNQGRFPVLLAHPASVAHGLNLQAGGHAVCWFGLTWSLEEHIQLNARVYRQGQTKPVVIHYLAAKDTVDEDIAQALANKADVQEAIFNRLKGHQ